MKKTEITVEDLLRGDVLLTRVRKIHNLKPEATKDHLDYKFQIEAAEYIDNPFRPLNPTSVFNEGDSRFVGQTPRRGWTTIEPGAWNKYFGMLVSAEEVSKLKFSSTSHQDVQTPDEQKEGIHFITLGVVNPFITINGQKLSLHVQVVETTLQRNKNQRPKLNPSNSEVQTENGNPIFVNGNITFGKIPSIFIESDQMKTAISEGRLQPRATSAETWNTMLASNAPSNLSGVSNTERELVAKDVDDLFKSRA